MPKAGVKQQLPPCGGAGETSSQSAVEPWVGIQHCAEITEHVKELPKNSNPTAISTLTLANFRNYSHLTLNTDTQPVVLTGSNGAGKTNILEAISFLSPGTGLRGARLADADHMSSEKKSEDSSPSSLVAHSALGSCASQQTSTEQSYKSSPWSLHTTLATSSGPHTVGTGRVESEGRGKRIVKIDNEPVKEQGALTELLTVIWLTPQMDSLFLDGAGSRRRFLDRLTYGFVPTHARTVNAYDRAKNERKRLLNEGRTDPHWLTALERKMAETGVAIAAARNEMIERLNAAFTLSNGPFPKAIVAIEGTLEKNLTNTSAIEAEETFSNLLQNQRNLDAKSGRTNSGPHRSDLRVTHWQKNLPAERCSTGEQKALMLSIVLAEARAKQAWYGDAPIILLDEVIAHLDANRRSALFDELCDLGVQAWLTGTDPLLFEGLTGRAQFFEVNNGTITGK